MTFRYEVATSYGEEPIDLPISDFVIDNIGSYSKLNPENRMEAKAAYIKAITEAINESQKIELNSEIEAINEGVFYEVHKRVIIGDQEVGFVIKILKSQDIQEFRDHQQDYKTIRRYCPSIVLPAEFVTASINGESRFIVLQREVAHAMTLEQYVYSYLIQGKEIPQQVKDRISQYASGLRKMYQMDGWTIDPLAISPDGRGLLVDSENDQIWLVDTNNPRMIYREESVKIYFEDIQNLEDYPDRIFQHV